MDDRDIGKPSPLRLEVFGGEAVPRTTDERLYALIEFVAELDDRLKELEGFVTEIVTQDVTHPRQPDD